VAVVPAADQVCCRDKFPELFGEFEETGAAIKREAGTGDASNLAWAGLMAMMVGARVPVQQAAKRSQRVALKR
jgi:hypothetical protein